MVTNSFVTIYHRIKGSDHDTFSKTVVKAWYHESITENRSTDGLKANTNITNVANVRIPDLSVVVEVGDIIVKGIGEDITSVKDLKNHHVIILANYNEYGHSPHIRIKAV